MTKTITRFAPSPTGFLHIGGARTALFNYLFAKHHSGTYLVRIEDTDQKRSTDQAKQAIIDGLQWLGLGGDQPITYQSHNIQRHQQIAHQLVKDNKAYYCTCTPETLQQQRQQAIEKGENFIGYNRKCRTLPPSPPDKPFTIRIKTPINDNNESLPSTIDDLVQGSVTAPQNTLDDFIILRQDGTPPYMLSVVVDDHDAAITHIIRGDDHLMNAHRQKILFDACGWNSPQFAHIPLIHGDDGKKLSKRHGALAVSEYRSLGYLPQAVNNHILKLGWGHQDQEFFSMEQAIKLFDIKNVNKAAAQFDFQKLDFFNHHYMQILADDELSAATHPFLNDEIKNNPSTQTLLPKILPAIKSGQNTLKALAETAAIFIASPACPPKDDKAKKLLNDNKDNISYIYDTLQSCDDWQEQTLKNLFDAMVEKHAISKKTIMQMNRVCLVGVLSSPGGVTDILCALGKEESLKRIKSCADYLQT